MKFTEKVMNTVHNALRQQEQVAGQLEILEAQFKAQEISGKAYEEEKTALEKQKIAILHEAEQQLQEINSEYCKAAEKGQEIDGSMLHEDAKLLQLDLQMTPHQFEALVEKHKDNPLMVQLLQEYSNKHEGLYAGYLPTADAKISAFAGFVGAARNTIRMPNTLQAAMFQEGRYTPQICTESE